MLRCILKYWFISKVQINITRAKIRRHLWITVFHKSLKVIWKISSIAYRCTVDPYLFENFLTEDGDLLRAKFKAFKFPESNFVLFRGVVNVCLDKCQGVSAILGGNVTSFQITIVEINMVTRF